MEGMCEAALNSKPGGHFFFFVCFGPRCTARNLKHKEEIQNKMINSQIPGLERVGKLPDTAQRGQVAHHGFNPCFVLQREETQVKTAAENRQDHQVHVTSDHSRIIRKVMESWYWYWTDKQPSLVGTPGWRKWGNTSAFFLLQVSS